MRNQVISSRRTPLQGSFECRFRIENENERPFAVTVLGEKGRGGSCICYEVEVEDETAGRERMILKQFYPYLAGNHEISANLQGIELTIHHLDKRPDIQQLERDFEQAFWRQKDLANRLDTVVKPIGYFFQGTTKLVLYEHSDGESLDKFLTKEPENLLEMLHALAQAAFALHGLHEAGFLHMDFKPENILWNHREAKLFDFDAMVDMRSNAPITTIGYDGSKEALLAPEIRNIHDKSVELLPRIDIYSLGGILFEYVMKRYPTDLENTSPEKCRDRFHDKLHEVYGDEFTMEQQEALFEIIRRSIHGDRTERYQTAKEMGNALKKLAGEIKSYQKKRFRDGNNELLAAYVLDKHPCFQYQCAVEGSLKMDVAIVGTAPIREPLLKYIFASAQLPDVDLHIRLFAPDAEKYMEQLVEECPQLKTTAYLYRNSERYQEEPLDTGITDKPFAYLYFYDTEEKVAAEYLSGKGSTYYLLVDEDTRNNKKLAKELSDHFAQPGPNIFIGYGQLGNGGEEMVTDLASPRSRLQLQAFCCDANTTKKEALFETEIYEKALKIHTFYTKEYDEKQDRKEIRKNLFQKDAGGKCYNLKSSVRNVLAIPYKYAFCNIQSNADMARVFLEKVILAQASEEENLLQKIAYLEHISWMCFMIIEGYRRPTDAELESYLYRDGNDHRNKKEKLHPCICSSTYMASKNVKDLSHRQWDNETLLTDLDYDELDRMSLKLHHMCQKRIRKINLEEEFQKLERLVAVRSREADLAEMSRQLYRLYRRMLAAESNVNLLWKRAYSRLEKALQEAGAVDALHILRGIKASMRIVVERNLYHDYKILDTTVIMAIPGVMMKQEAVYARIYKTPSVKVGDMVMSAILMEPEELVLLEDDAAGTVEDAGRQEELIKAFLKERGLGHIKVSSCALEKMRLSKKKAGLDITGCSPEFMMRLLRSGWLLQMPLFSCKNGKVVPEMNAEDVQYYMQPRHLNVEELFQLYNAPILPDTDEKYMMRLENVYQQLWSAYVEIGDDTLWESVCSFLRRMDSHNSWEIPGELSSEMGVFYSHPTRRDSILLAGLCEVLQDLQGRGYLEHYSLPPEELDEGVITLECPEEILTLINACIDRLESGRHRFRVKGTGEKVYICDDTVSCEGSVAPCDNLDAEALGRVLETLYQKGQINHQECILQRKAGKPFVVQLEDGSLKVAFRFANNSVKQILLSGELLETFAYHTILQNGHMKDVRAGVNWDWENVKEKDAGNKIDIVCTRGLQTFFILCLQKPPTKENLAELKYFCDYLGVDAKAIVLCSHEAVGARSFYETDSQLRDRCKVMNIYFVNRWLIGDNDIDISGGKLARVLDRIADGQSRFWLEEQ